LAAAKGHCDIVNFLAKKECDLNGKTKIKNESYTAMHLATLQNHTNVVKCLLENGAKFRIKDHYGFSVIICAVVHGRVEIANELINKGAGVNFINIFTYEFFLRTSFSTYVTREKMPKRNVRTKNVCAKG